MFHLEGNGGFEIQKGKWRIREGVKIQKGGGKNRGLEENIPF